MTEEDHYVYVKCSNNSFIILSLYVDDILIAGNNKEMIETTKRWLSSNFEMKDMGEVNYILSVKIIRDCTKRLLSLIQETYIKKILECYHIQYIKSIDTYVDKSLSPSCDMCPKTLEEKKKTSKVPYANVIGSLIHAMMYICLDICYVIGLVSRYQSNLIHKH